MLLIKNINLILKLLKLLIILLLVSIYPKTKVYAGNVLISPDWNSKISNVSTLPKFNTNMFDTSIANLTNVQYLNAVKQTNSKFIRIHNAFLADLSTQNVYGLTEIINNQLHWNRAKLKLFSNAIKNLRSNGYAPELMFNIPTLPTYFDPFLDKNQYKSFMSELVIILNIEEGLGIKYFEITNELDDDFTSTNGCSASGLYCNKNFSELINLYNIAATAMKEIDPNIKTGGLSYQNPFANIDQFLAGTNSNTLDFLSVHRYNGLGNPVENEYDLLKRPKILVKDLTAQLKQKLVSANSNALLFINEYNICYVYLCGFNNGNNASNSQMSGQTGALFDALGYLYAIEANLDGLFTWNEKDQFYGKIDSSYNIRPAGYVQKMFNNLEISAIFNHTNSNNAQNEGDIKTLAFKTKNGKKGVILINRGLNNDNITINGAVGQIQHQTLINQAFNEFTLTTSSDYNFNLNANSVSIIQYYENSSSITIKANLRGSFVNSSFNTVLNSSYLLPIKQPYFKQFNYQGSEVLTLNQNNVVDWVLVTINDTDGINTFAMLLFADGSIKNSNGDQFTMYNKNNKQIGVTIQHRNHLGISSNNPVLIGANTVIDFTDNLNVKANNQKQLANGKFGLIPANAFFDNSIDASDRNALFLKSENSAIYNSADVNLDGNIDAADRNLLKNQQDAIEVL